MNRVFRIVWSTALNTWVVASELTATRGKGSGATGGTDERVTSSRRTLRLAVIAALALLHAPAAWSATLYWDVNGGQVGNGGTGTWNTGSSFWNSASDGVAGPFVTWNNAALDTAFFTGTPGTVTLGSPITVGGLTFGAAGYTLTGNTLTLAGATPTISVTTGTSTIASALAGTQGFIKAGGGALALRGANTFGGLVDVQAGTLAVENEAAVGAAANSIRMAAGTALTATTAISSRTVELTGGLVSLRGAAGSARFTGAGGISAFSGVTMGNAASDHTGITRFIGGGTYGFTSIGNVGEASALGAPTTAAEGRIVVQAGGGLGGTLNYSGDGDASDRDWAFQNTSSGGTALRNIGTGTLSLTGDVALENPWLLGHSFQAVNADIDVLGTISSTSDRTLSYVGGAGRTITLGSANTYAGSTQITTITVKADTLADTGTASSFGTGAVAAGALITLTNGTLSYTGDGDASNRRLASDGNAALRNDGTGALALSGTMGFVAGGTDTLTLGGSFAGTNTLSGVMSGNGNVVMNGAGEWVLSGANTYTGTTTVQAGTLTAGSAEAFGASRGLVVNGGTLDLNDQNIVAPSLAGTGGTVDLGSGTLSLRSTTGTTSYAGTITGAGGLTKLGASTQTLTGANTYTGATTIGGGTLALDFGGAGAPASDIVAAASSLNLGGGTLAVRGATGANAQAFDGLNVTAGSNRINATAASGGTLQLQVGDINRTGGLVDFGFNAGATIATTEAEGALGGWATVNGTDYAQVLGGVITAFTDYADKDDASTWLTGDIVSDEGGNPNTAYFGTVNGDVALGGLKYTALANSTVNVGATNTLGVDGNIIVASTVGGAAQRIQGGSITGGAGGSPLGVLQNSGGTFYIDSTIVDNGGATSFAVGGTGTGQVVLSGANTYTGSTTVSGGILSFNSVANAGTASALGASGADPANLVFENGTLRYTGNTASTDRGFTLVNGGPSRSFQVDGTTNLTFGGVVTSPDDAGFTKTGTGTLTLSNGANDFAGIVTVSGGELSVDTLANGGQASGIGAGVSDPAGLVLQGGGSLQYTGATTSTDRGFTLAGGQGRVDVATAATTLAIGGTVVGQGALYKDGDGTLVLTGTNTYTGGNTVTAGTLRAGSGQAFGGAANGTGAGPMTVAAGATLDLDDNSVFVGGLYGAGSVTLGTGTLQVNNGGTFTGAISGTGGVTTTRGVQAMNGCGNAYTGVTRISGSAISTDCLADGGQASGIGAAASDPANLVLANGTLQYTGGDVDTDRGFTMAGAGTITVTDAAATLGIGGAITGTGALYKRGAGTLVLSNANTYTSGTSVNEGTLRAGVQDAFGTGTTGGAMTVANVANAVLDLDGYDTAVRSLYGGGTTGGTVLLGGATLSFWTTSNSTAEYAGTIAEAGSIVQRGNYRQALTGCGSSYTGTTTITAGTLAVQCLDDGGANSSIGASGADAANLVISGGTLQYIGAGSTTDRLFTLGPSTTSAIDASGTGAVRFTNTGAIAFSTPGTAQTITLTGTSTADNSLAARIDNNAGEATSLRKLGTGTWILRNSASTYTGATTILGGVLGVDKLSNGGVASSIGASSGAASNLVIGSDSTLRYTGAGDTTDRLFTLSTGVSFIESSGTGAIVFSNTGSAAYSGNGNRTLALGGSNAGDNTMGGTIINGPGGTTTLAKNGTGTWLLTGNNSYTGNTVINGGTLQIGNGGTTGSIASANIINAAGTLAFDRADTLALAGTISGAGNVRQSGAGTTVLTATNTYTGGTNITAGTLQLGDGGTTGSILGDVANDGTLAFNRVDAHAFAGLISGTGGLSQRGAGTTVLTAANTYAGATDIASGTLLVNGNQSAATGLATVASGATLGGFGTLGGDVSVLDGGSLAPGNAGAAGTLTINGDLTLASGARLGYQLGQANVVGGTLNDLTVVHGDLTLDGTLDFGVTPGGSIGPGLYRIVSYDGTLIDRGLNLGTTPVGTFQVQTSVANQVNLLSSSGLSLNFWDGPGNGGNSTVDGGSGVWQNGAGNDNWTDQTGQYNAPYADGQFAIFMGNGGTVTVDDGLGAVTSSGMQFAVDGYTLDGDALTLNGGPSIVRVGDGTSAGAGMSAEIALQLSGTGGLVKDDLGTLVLSGTNTYAGGTAINDGVLEVSSDANLGAGGGGLAIDGGTLRNTAAMVSARQVTIGQEGATFDNLDVLVLNGTIDGAGALTKTGSGSLALAGANTYAGGTRILGGEVTVQQDANLGASNGTLALDDGALHVLAGFSSSRAVTLGAGNGRITTDGDLTLNGAITGPGALMKNGAGTLVVGADSSWGAGTYVLGGTLQVGDGGTTGAMTGFVANDGQLAFNRSNLFAFDGEVSGSGTLTQVGPGTTVLTADNRYVGATTVSNGTLIINGNQSAATGLTTVNASGALGGTGVIGGDVVVDGTLRPGDVGNVPGTLTIGGGLAFGGTSTLAVDLGQANVVAGAFNDLVEVAGDLTLDGTLDVAVSSGGTFDPGIYRIVSYGGTLNDNGLDIGSVPSPDYYLQTSITQQVNLVNTNGLDVNFWDGNGARGDSQVQGGDGVWQNAAGNDNWTLIDGSINAPYSDGVFAVFGGTAGDVIVDGSLGAVVSGGMQFASNNYRVEGDAIELTGGAPIIRVGDGTSAGQSYTATIASQLTGTDGLTKTDLGTLVLTGENTYTGGTTVREGALVLGENGASGSILGDVALGDGGLLVFRRSDPYAFDGTITGTGAVMQNGSSVTILSGNNRYTGQTRVQSGTLLVNGDQTAATGQVTVANGATLGGAGIVGGDVHLLDGATLSPGATGAAGTFTVLGDLTLAANSHLSFQFGQANVPGGALNDLAVVRGDLTLDGTLDALTTPGGTFGAGVYRLFSYDGALVNNGLEVGATPDLFVQTSLANQVNLVNTSGLELTFWDAPGNANDGAITGGTGTWRLSDNDYWADASGALNAAFSNDAFAVFGGTAGTVTVDNANGQVGVSGMQFQSGGYVIDGGDIALAGGAVSIRVGDGTTTGVDMTATIDARIFGSGMLVKDDLGTLVLEADNAWVGGTTVRAGVLQISSDANLGVATGVLVIDAATLRTTASFASARTIGLEDAAIFDTADGTTLTLTGDINGSGGLTKAGAGTLALSGASNYTGDTAIAAGTLQAGAEDAFAASSAFSVRAGGTLDLAGHAQQLSSLSNAGDVRFGAAPGTTLTVRGDYTGQGGALHFNTRLGGDASQTDRLVVAGDTSGDTTVRVTNVGGAGAPTVEGIKLIDVQGASNGRFALQGDYVFQGEQAVVAGAYGYRLYKDGTANVDGDWYLRSALLDTSGGPDPDNPGEPGPGGGETPLYQPGVPLYEAYAGMLQHANALDTLVQRVGNRSGSASADGSTPGTGAWIRVQGADQRFRPEVTTSGTDYDVQTWTSELGVDTTLSEGEGGRLVGGATLRYGRYDTDASSRHGSGRIRTDGYGAGVSLTWYDESGFYADGQARWNRFDSDLRSTALGQLLESGNDAKSYAWGLEIGQAFAAGEHVSLVPQVQVTWGEATFDRFDDAFDVAVSQRDGKVATARAGLAVDWRGVRDGASGAVDTHVYAIANLYRNLRDNVWLDVAGTRLDTRNERDWAGFGVGGSLDWAGGRYSLYGEVMGQTGLTNGDSDAVNATLGFRSQW